MTEETLAIFGAGRAGIEADRRRNQALRLRINAKLAHYDDLLAENVELRKRIKSLTGETSRGTVPHAPVGERETA